MVCLSRPYPSTFFKGCLPQNLFSLVSFVDEGFRNSFNLPCDAFNYIKAHCVKYCRSWYKAYFGLW